MTKAVVKRSAPTGVGGGGRWAWQTDDADAARRQRAAAAGAGTSEGDGDGGARPGASSSGAQNVDSREAPAAEDDERGGFATSPAQLPKAGWKDVVSRTLKEVKADNVPLTAAGVAFYGMLALVAIVSVYGLVTTPAESAKQVEGFTSAFPGDAARQLVDQLKSITGASSSGLGLKLAISLAGLLWSASSGTTALIRGLGIAYDQPEGRGFVSCGAPPSSSPWRPSSAPWWSSVSPSPCRPSSTPPGSARRARRWAWRCAGPSSACCSSPA